MGDEGEAEPLVGPGAIAPDSGQPGEVVEEKQPELMELLTANCLAKGALMGSSIRVDRWSRRLATQTLHHRTIMLPHTW